MLLFLPRVGKLHGCQMPESHIANVRSSTFKQLRAGQANALVRSIPLAGRVLRNQLEMVVDPDAT